MLNVIAVGAGGFIGAVLRYGAGVLCKNPAMATGFPVATFCVNVLGSFLIGLASAYFIKQGNPGGPLQLFIMVGVMGGFTTFSSFSLETINMLTDGRMGMAAANVLLSVGLCLLGVWAGRLAGSGLFGA